MKNLEYLKTAKENQTFDRKSIRIKPKALAIPMVAFANADGGTIVIGINDNGEIEGIKGYEKKVNEILRTGYDFCKPTVQFDYEKLNCKDSTGKENQILVLNIHQSHEIHSNQKDEVYYRVGDKSKKLTFEERLQLTYDKGEIFYEDTFINQAT